MQFKTFDETTLSHVAHFMGLTPVTGLTTINNLIGFFGAKIPINAPIIRIFTKKVLTRSINLYFDKIRKEDELMSFEQVDKFSDTELDTVCFKRGINLE